jgi:hypothetical protein
MQEGAVRLNVDTHSRSFPSAHPRHDARERRLELLIRRLPQRVRVAVHWLRRPSARWLRIPAGLLLIAGGFLSILPIFGLWMLPLGLVLLAEDVPPLRRATDRVLAWIEQHRPHWMGLPRAPDYRSTSKKETQ